VPSVALALDPSVPSDTILTADADVAAVLLGVPMKKLLLALFVTVQCGLALAAEEQLTFLACKGDLYWYESGYGERAERHNNYTMTFTINRTARTFNGMLPIIGEFRAPLTESATTYGAVVKLDNPVFLHGEEFTGGGLVVNRVTGESSFVYHLAGKRMLAGFIGECRRADRKF
jgi:hypothetical protein